MSYRPLTIFAALTAAFVITMSVHAAPPTGIVLAADDGAVYVSNAGPMEGKGAIVRVPRRLGVDPQLMSVADFDKFVHDDFAATVQLAQDAHIEPTD